MCIQTLRKGVILDNVNDIHITANWYLLHATLPRHHIVSNCIELTVNGSHHNSNPISDWHHNIYIWHDNVIKCIHFLRNWPFVRGIHRSPLSSRHKGKWRRTLIFSLICVWINGWINNRQADDLRRYPAHYDVTVMLHKSCHLTHARPCIMWLTKLESL